MSKSFPLACYSLVNALFALRETPWHTDSLMVEVCDMTLVCCAITCLSTLSLQVIVSATWNTWGPTVYPGYFSLASTDSSPWHCLAAAPLFSLLFRCAQNISTATKLYDIHKPFHKLKMTLFWFHTRAQFDTAAQCRRTIHEQNWGVTNSNKSRLTRLQVL